MIAKRPSSTDGTASQDRLLITSSKHARPQKVSTSRKLCRLGSDNEIEMPLGIFIERAVMERTDPKMLLPALLQRSTVYSEAELGNGTGTF